MARFSVSASPVELRRGDTVSAALQIDNPEKIDGELQVGQSHEFNLQLPADAPPAYSTGVGQMWWAVMVHSDQVGPDKYFSQRVEVVLSSVST